MPCVLLIMGETFDPATAPELARLKPYWTYRRNDPNQGHSGFTEVGGLNCEVSAAKKMLEMVEDASYYLTRHHDLLMTLDAIEAVRYRTLAFHITPQEFKAMGSRFTLPPTLLRICVELTLGLSLIVH